MAKKIGFNRTEEAEKTDTLYFTKMEKGSCVIMYNDGLNRRAEFPDGSKVIIVKNESQDNS